MISRLDRELKEIILKLYTAEQLENGLQDDGLERGIMALEFVSKCMDVEEYIRSQINFDKLGIIMQIVDDVLDLEEDQSLGEMNCLLNARKSEYLKLLIEYDVDTFRKVFPRAHVLLKVLGMAQEKARTISD